jgi:hypothetical protein
VLRKLRRRAAAHDSDSAPLTWEATRWNLLIAPGYRSHQRAAIADRCTGWYIGLATNALAVIASPDPGCDDVDVSTDLLRH